MNKINFEALPSTETPLSPGNLNTIQDNIDNAKLEKTCKTITDWNTEVETGFVQTGPGILNGPSGVDYIGGFVLKRVGHVLQVAIASRTGVMYTRSSLDGINWNDWCDLKTELSNKVSKLSTFSGDLNDINDTCIYYAATNTNIPMNSGYGYCITIKMSASYMVQYYERRTDQVTYKRFKENGEWGSWMRVYTTKITTGTEFETGRIIDGKKEYGKRISCGTLPKTGTKEIAHGLGNVTVIDYKGIAGGRWSLPFASTNDQKYNIQLQLSSSNIAIRTGVDDYGDVDVYVTIYYTKN